MNIDELLKNPAFKNLEQSRIELFKKMYSEMQGKNQMEQMAIFMKYSKSISNGKKIPKEEQRLMIEVMMDSLPQEERGAFQNMVKMMDAMK